MAVAVVVVEVEENNRNVVAVGVYSFTIHEFEAVLKKVECRVDMGPM